MMKTFTDAFDLADSDIANYPDIIDKNLFFDIETTGLSSKRNKIYFIGFAFFQNSKFHINQFFSEDNSDEIDVLTSFSDVCKNFTSTVSFNGMGFDIPFIQERCRQYNLPDPFLYMQHIDIFKQVSSLKKLFKLPNLKQKTIEDFLGITREDIYSGGELIQVYQDYLVSPDEDKLHLLQLHNKDDVRGMLNLMPILNYNHFFQGNFEVCDMELHSYQNHDGLQEKEILFTLSSSRPFPKRVSFGTNDIYLTGFQECVRIKVNVYEGELKYFYPNYQDYYYLPKEDMAFHKSVAFYVDKEFRTKAKASTCYSKRTGMFLPQYENCFSPYFKFEYKEKMSYLELTEDFTTSKEFQKNYLLHLLEHLFSIP